MPVPSNSAASILSRGSCQCSFTVEHHRNLRKWGVGQVLKTKPGMGEGRLESGSPPHAPEGSEQITPTEKNTPLSDPLIMPKAQTSHL